VRVGKFFGVGVGVGGCQAGEQSQCVGVGGARFGVVDGQGVAAAVPQAGSFVVDREVADDRMARPPA
jgi:hypothetical protein